MNLFILSYCVFLNMLYTFLLLFLYFNLYFNVEPLRVSMFVNKETTYLLSLFLQPRSPHGASIIRDSSVVETRSQRQIRTRLPGKAFGNVVGN